MLLNFNKKTEKKPKRSQTNTNLAYNKASELYDKLLSIYKTQYDKLTKAQKKRIKVQDMPENLPIDL